MFSLTHKSCTTLVASGFIALSSLAAPVYADDPVEHLGPVGPHEPILTNVGSKRVIAFYTPGETRVLSKPSFGPKRKTQPRLPACG